MYRADLSIYDHGARSPGRDSLNIGWLERGRPFPTGAVLPEFISALRFLVAKPVGLTCGYHTCEFCSPPPRTLRDGDELEWNAPPPEILGNGQIHVVASDGNTYVAPVLIRHYVEVHRYMPPDIFIEACIKAAKKAST